MIVRSSANAARHPRQGLRRPLLWARAVALFCLALPLAVSANPEWTYGSRGLEWSNGETGSFLWLGLRGQFRASNSHDSAHSPEDFDGDYNSGLRVQRARYKIGAGWRDSFTFYHEYDLRNYRLLDLRATWVDNPGFKLRLGQWKSEYNRARVDSSGKQQFAERSIATYWFTIDRQWGLGSSGRVAQGTAWDSNWWAGVLGGNGRGTRSDGGRPMVFARWQWNYSGKVLPFSQSAVKRYTEPHASLAFGLVSNDSRYTRYSSSGGGNLEGYSEGSDNQYRIHQAMQEWAWQHNGFSVQQELHWKRVEDREAGGSQQIRGGYLQGGWFPASHFQGFPEPLEFAARVAHVDTGDAFDTTESELSIAGNWFFDGHRNKLTAEAAWLAIDENRADASEWRFRLQWDLSL